MQSRLIIAQSFYLRAREGLFPDSGSEGLVFFLAGKCSGESWLTLSVREILVPTQADFVCRGAHGIELSDDAKVRVMLKARSTGLCLIEAHSHPAARSKVTLSAYDWENAKEFVPYVHLKVGCRPYCTLVYGQESADGFVWLPGHKNPIPLSEILIVGAQIGKIFPTSSGHEDASRGDFVKFDRQLRAFGHEGQARIAGLRVGIVGCGGVGSLVVQQLVHLGVQKFKLIDDDAVEVTNLNRLVGANNWDVSAAKVSVLGRLIHTVNPLATVTALRANVRTPEAVQALRDVDIIFGCTDSDSSRLILNELATACLIPYIDVATGIESHGGIVDTVGGRLLCVLPGFPCLRCSQEIDLKEAHDELTSSRELEFRKTRGYTSEKIEAPSVISLNGVMASLAVTEFLAMTTRIKETVPCLYYYADKNALKVRRWKKDLNCLNCSEAGVGDQINLERFAYLELPTDLPD